jgi:hypothetical protein
MKEGEFAWRTVIEVQDGTIDLFSDGMVMNLKDSDITFSITGEAFEFLKDKLNDHV